MFEIGTQQHRNCLLCAVHRSTRNITVEYMFQITHLITGLFSITDVQEYIHSTRMDKPGAWETEVKIMTLSYLVNTHILVYMQELGMWTVSTPDLIISTRRGYASKK